MGELVGHWRMGPFRLDPGRFLEGLSQHNPPLPLGYATAPAEVQEEMHARLAALGNGGHLGVGVVGVETEGDMEIPGQLIGEIYSFSVVTEPQHAPEGYEEFAPYVVALVDVYLEGRRTRRLTMRMTDLEPGRPMVDQLMIGDQVEVVTRVLKHEGDKGIIVYGYAARLLPEWREKASE